MENGEPGILSFITSNVTDAGASLSEQEFHGTMRAVWDEKKTPAGIFVGMGTIRKAQKDRDVYVERTIEADRTYRRTSRWRWLKRHRALREFHAATQAALVLEKMFGSHFT